jgi:hypothetical protein
MLVAVKQYYEDHLAHQNHSSLGLCAILRWRQLSGESQQQQQQQPEGLQTARLAQAGCLLAAVG